jgi:hypothetical protein
MRIFKYAKVSALFVAIAVVMGLGVGAANATDLGSPPGDSTGYTGDNPVILAAIAEAAATADDFTVVSKQYVADSSKSIAAAPAAFPSGCGLVVLLHRSGMLISGDVFTDCDSVFTEGVQNAALGHYNPDWLTWDEKDYDSTTAAIGTFMASYVSYNCSNTNLSGWRLTGGGNIVIGATYYTASAYDQLEPFLQNCGT